MDRLLTAYQEDLLSLDELRRRMPELRQRERALQAELQSILDQVNDRAVYLRLAETLSSFLARLRTSADTLDIQERQRIVRLVVKEILVGDETIVIRHSIPLSSKPPNDSDPQPPPSGPGAPDDQKLPFAFRASSRSLRRPPVRLLRPRPSSSTPASSHFRMRRLMRRSAIRCSRKRTTIRG